MKSARRASAVVALALATILTAACSGPASVPPDYHRIGAAGSDVLYAKVAHESDGDYADVLLRTRDGDTLCDARGPLMMDAAQGFAICDGGSPEVYVYVAQTSKTGPATQLCRQDDQAVAAERLRTDGTWPADFTVSVDRSGDQFSFVLACSALVAE
jgi:hypothetical protein